MHKRLIIRETETGEPVLTTGWALPEEFDEAWECCLSKPFFYGDERVYEKEVEYKREFSVHFTDIFGYSSERVFETAKAAIAHANKRFMLDQFFRGVFVMDDSTGEIIFNMKRDLFYDTSEVHNEL